MPLPTVHVVIRSSLLLRDLISQVSRVGFIIDSSLTPAGVFANLRVKRSRFCSPLPLRPPAAAADRMQILSAPWKYSPLPMMRARDVKKKNQRKKEKNELYSSVHLARGRTERSGRRNTEMKLGFASSELNINSPCIKRNGRERGGGGRRDEKVKHTATWITTQIYEARTLSTTRSFLGREKRSREERANPCRSFVIATVCRCNEGAPLFSRRHCRHD